MTFSNNKSKKQSLCGVFAGVCMFVLLVSYAGLKMEVMLAYGENIVQEPSIERYFSNEYIFDSSHGFEVAFGISAYTEAEQGDALDETYGKLTAWQKVWGEIDENTGIVKPLEFKKLKLAPCKIEEFAFSSDKVKNSNARFYPAGVEYEIDLIRHFDKFMCV